MVEGRKGGERRGGGAEKNIYISIKTKKKR